MGPVRSGPDRLCQTRLIPISPDGDIKVSVRNLSTPVEIVHHMLKIWTDEGDPSKRCKTSNTHAEAILKIFLIKNPES